MIPVTRIRRGKKVRSVKCWFCVQTRVNLTHVYFVQMTISPASSRLPTGDLTAWQYSVSAVRFGSDQENSIAFALL